MNIRGAGAASIRDQFVSSVYATHNGSRVIADALGRCLAALGEDDLALNVGSGPAERSPRLINLDICPAPGVQCISDASALPFGSGSFALVISQETLEHVPDPASAATEIWRVLRPGGRFYCQVPFVIGYHPGPTDYWRFTREGVRQLLENAGFACEELSVAVGAGTGFYRIVVEFVAVLAARVWPRLYFPAKGAAALAFYPLKWLDPVLRGAPQEDRIAGGYCVMARKLQGV